MKVVFPTCCGVDVHKTFVVVAIYSMLCTGEVWNPVDLFKIDMPEH